MPCARRVLHPMHVPQGSCSAPVAFGGSLNATVRSAVLHAGIGWKQGMSQPNASAERLCLVVELRGLVSSVGEQTS